MNKELFLIDSSRPKACEVGRSPKRVKRWSCNSDRLSWDQLQNVVTVREVWEVRVGTEGPCCGWFSNI